MPACPNRHRQTPLATHSTYSDGGHNQLGYPARISSGVPAAGHKKAPTQQHRIIQSSTPIHRTTNRRVYIRRQTTAVTMGSKTTTPYTRLTLASSVGSWSRGSGGIFDAIYLAAPGILYTTGLSPAVCRRICYELGAKYAKYATIGTHAEVEGQGRGRNGWSKSQLKNRSRKQVCRPAGCRLFLKVSRTAAVQLGYQGRGPRPPRDVIMK